MAPQRQVEIFSAGCPLCQDAIAMVESIASAECHVTVLDMHEAEVADRAKRLGIRSVPAVVIDGKVADCCAGRGPDKATLQAAGVGQPL